PAADRRGGPGRTLGRAAWSRGPSGRGATSNGRSKRAWAAGHPRAPPRSVARDSSRESKLTPQLAVATLAGMLRRILHPPTDDAPDDPDRQPAADGRGLLVSEPDLSALPVVGIT